MTLTVVSPDQRYRGRSYSEWIEEWSNLLVSPSPDFQRSSDMLFLRGYLDYEADQGGYRVIKPGKFLDRTGSLGQSIYSDTALFIPVMTAMYSINDPYGTRQLIDEQDLRNAVRSDLAEGKGMWIRYRDANADFRSLLSTSDKLKNYYFETRVFTLKVSNQSPLINKFETALSPGEYDTVQGGYFLIVTLNPGKYRFHFGGNGRGEYYTDAVYDITVRQETYPNLASDESNKNLPTGGPNSPNRVKALKSYRHLKNEDDIDNTSPFP